MATAKVIWIDGVPYAAGHPRARARAIAQAKQFSAGGPIVPMGRDNGNAPGTKSARAFISAEDRLNQTEKRWLAILRERCVAASPIWIQAIRLELAPGCCYLPDFAALIASPKNTRLTFFEVKGPRVWDDAIVKIKTAAVRYPEFDFWFCQYKNNQWAENLMPK